MRRFWFFLGACFVALVLGGYFSLTVEAQQPENSSKVSDASSATDDRTRMEKETFSLINDYRKANDLPVLKWDSDIADVARGHSKDMATGAVDFGHEGFGKRVEVLKTKMVGVNGAGENVFKTEDPNQVAQMAVKIWLHSPHHLANIQGDFNYTGVGVWKDDQGTFYFTQFFVKIQPRAKPVAEAPAPQVTSPYSYLAKPTTR